MSLGLGDRPIDHINIYKGPQINDNNEHYGNSLRIMIMSHQICDIPEKSANTDLVEDINLLNIFSKFTNIPIYLAINQGSCSKSINIDTSVDHNKGP